jgi:hypothetical protein
MQSSLQLRENAPLPAMLKIKKEAGMQKSTLLQSAFYTGLCIGRKPSSLDQSITQKHAMHQSKEAPVCATLSPV